MMKRADLDELAVLVSQCGTNDAARTLLLTAVCALLGNINETLGRIAAALDETKEREK